MKKQSVASLLVAAAVLACSGAAHAQAAGTWWGTIGWNKIMPKTESGDLSQPSLPGSKVNIRSASALYFTAGYMFTDALAAEFLFGLPYKHDIDGAGALAGTGKIGSIHQVSPTLLLEYKFMDPNAAFRPYLGAGPTFVKYYKSEGSATLTALTNPGGPATTIGGDTEWGATIAAGGRYRIDSHWFLNAAVFKTWVKNKATLSTGQTIRENLNPVSINASIGYAF